MIIKNEIAQIEFKNTGAEITSFKLKNNDTEFMWQGDAKYWSGRNPILFPMVGSTYDKILHIDGKEFTMDNHGFCRKVDFKCEGSTENSITFSYEANDITLKQYPYDFKISVTYTLIGAKCLISYDIDNRGNDEMPFNFGLHPAFNCPIDPTMKFTDYRVDFACIENQDFNHVLNNEDKINLDHELFVANPTLFFKNTNSPYITLTDGKYSVKVECAGYRYLAIWTPSDAPFVCLEPWHSKGDFEKVVCEFKDREGTLILKPKTSFTTQYSIEISCK